VCRSPFAAAYLSGKFRERNCPIKVSSAGLTATQGEKANPVASNVALQNDISLAAHIAKPITSDLVRLADLIVVMEFSQYMEVLQKFPEARSKLFRLGDFHEGLAREIWDPYGGSESDFEFCFRMIRQCCDNLMGAVSTAKQGAKLWQ